MGKAKYLIQVVPTRSGTRGDVSYEFFFQSGDMSNLAYIGTKNLNLTGFVYFCFKINKSCYWSKIQIFGTNVG